MLATLLASFSYARSQTSAFMYQGRLMVAGSPANGNYDLTFALFNQVTGPAQLGGAVTNLATPVTNGLFNVPLDFGLNIFTGPDFWLEISVRPNSINESFTVLNPRQQVLPVPYALHANSSSNLLGTLAAGQLAGTLPASALAGFSGPVVFTNQGSVFAGTFTGDGTGVSNVSVTTANLSGPGLNNQLNATPFKTPPMGWMSWNCCGNGGAAESNCLSVAHEMVADGALAAGYNLIQIDAGWQGYRDTNGFIHESTNRFPDGMSNTIVRLHALGFKVGIWHGILVNLTHNFYPQIPTNFVQPFFSDDDAALVVTNIDNDQALINDAQTFVQWGIDYVKLEGSTNAFYGIPSEAQEEHWYKLFTSTAQNAGKTLYIMGAVSYEASPWMPGVINARRNGGFDIFNGNNIQIFQQFMGNFNTECAHPEFSGPGCYVSLDAFPATYALFPTHDEDETFMLMTAMLNGELIWDTFYTTAQGVFSTPAALNANLISLDKDPAAIMARCVWTNGPVSVWKKPLGAPDATTFALAFFNTNHPASPPSPGNSTGGNTYTTLNDVTQQWAVNAYSNYQVQIGGGTGRYQFRNVVGNTATSLMISPPWTVVPDQTTSYSLSGTAAITTTVNLKDIGCASAQMLCLDLISNVSFVVTNSITMTVPEMTAYGFKLTPYVSAVGPAAALAAANGATVDFNQGVTTDFLAPGESNSTLWISIANGLISRIQPLAAPPPITVSNLSLWLSPGSIVTNSSGVVTQWADNSSQQNNAFPNVPPLYVANGFGNGHPALQFFGTNYLTLAVPERSSFTMFLVSSATSRANINLMDPIVVPHATNWDNLYADLFLRYDAGSGYYYDWLWGSLIPVSGSFNTSLGVTNILTVVVNADGTYTTYDRGVQTGGGQAPPSEIPLQPYMYIGGFPTAGDFLEGKIGEVVCYNRALSPQEITNVTWYLGTNNNVPTPALTAPAPAGGSSPVNLVGTFSGSGAGLTNLQSTNIVGAFGAMTATTYTGTQWAIPASTIDWSQGSYQYQSITTNIAYTFTNNANAMTLQVAVANAGSNTVTWPSLVKWPGGSPPIQTIGGHTDVYSFVQINGQIYGSVVHNY